MALLPMLMVARSVPVGANAETRARAVMKETRWFWEAAFWPVGRIYNSRIGIRGETASWTQRTSAGVIPS